MRRFGARPADSRTDAGRPRARRELPGVPLSDLFVDGDLARRAAIAPGVGKRAVMAAHPRQPGNSTAAEKEAATLALGPGSRACVALAIVLLSPRQSPPAPRELLTDAALAEVQQAEAAYARSIANLAAAAGPELQRSPSPLAAAYREKLTLLDSAIDRLKSTAAQNPYN